MMETTLQSNISEISVACPLVNVYYGQPPFILGEITLLTRPFSIANCNNLRLITRLGSPLFSSVFFVASSTAPETPPWLFARPGLHSLGSSCDPNDQDLLSEEVPATELLQLWPFTSDYPSYNMFIASYTTNKRP